ncbi:MAG: hypothetical protein ACK5LP_03495 [Campylobacteraceae bacterium]
MKTYFKLILATILLFVFTGCIKSNATFGKQKLSFNDEQTTTVSPKKVETQKEATEVKGEELISIDTQNPVVISSANAVIKTNTDEAVVPTTLVVQIDKFELEELRKNTTNDEYLNENELKEQFLAFINGNLKNANIKRDGKSVQVEISYSRIFNKDGQTLTHPKLKYSIKVFDLSGNLLNEYKSPVLSTERLFTDNMRVSMKMNAGEWTAKNEAEDVRVISVYIADKIREVSK